MCEKNPRSMIWCLSCIEAASRGVQLHCSSADFFAKMELPSDCMGRLSSKTNSRRLHQITWQTSRSLDHFRVATGGSEILDHLQPGAEGIVGRWPVISFGDVRDANLRRNNLYVAGRIRPYQDVCAAFGLDGRMELELQALPLPLAMVLS
jgi:hypothetical protein